MQTSFIRLFVQKTFTLWLAVSLMFVLLRILPGDAITAQLISSGASQGIISTQRAALGLDQPAAIQYATYLSRLLRGDLGESYLTGQPVGEIISFYVGNTLMLALCALLLSIALGLSLGILIVSSRSQITRMLASTTMNLALSLPIYWTGILAIAVFSIGLNVLPASGATDVRNLILPAGVLGFHTAGAIALMTRTQVENVTHADFVRTARGKGLRENTIWRRHILRVGLLPIVSVIALQAGFLLGGTVITEMLFLRPGLGTLLIDSVTRRDYPVVQGITLISASTFILVNGCSEWVNHMLDPRVRFSTNRS